MDNDELLKEVEEFAYAYLTRADISTITGIDIEELKDEELPAGKSFITGRLKRKAKFNMVVMALSDQLSSPAMNIEAKLASEALLNDLR